MAVQKRPSSALEDPLDRALRFREVGLDRKNIDDFQPNHGSLGVSGFHVHEVSGMQNPKSVTNQFQVSRRSRGRGGIDRVTTAADLRLVWDSLVLQEVAWSCLSGSGVKQVRYK